VSSFTDRVYDVVRSVPRGRVVSYGGVAALMGQPRAARGVGQALCALPDDADVPWWRVVNRNGEISITCQDHGAALQRALLEAEGVRFDDRGRLDWERHGWTPGLHRSVAFAVPHPEDPARVLTVQRPDDDADLPGMWGLPAASLAPGEVWTDAVERGGREKLGVELHRLRELRRGNLERPGYTLEMRLFHAEIARGEPAVPQPVPGVTQYQDWRWGTADSLAAADRAGSLCSRLYRAARGAAGP
jgi:methylated-DNA-protein-cysteine methyltransferase related protein